MEPRIGPLELALICMVCGAPVLLAAIGGGVFFFLRSKKRDDTGRMNQP